MFFVVCNRHSYELREELLKKRTRDNEEILKNLAAKVDGTPRELQFDIVEKRLTTREKK